MRILISGLLGTILVGCQLAPSTDSDSQKQQKPQDDVSQSVESSTSSSDEVTPSSAQDDETDALETEAIAEEKQPEPVITPQSQEDVWQRMAMQFEMEVPDHKTVNYYRTWYLKHPSHLRTVSQRAQPFMHLIVEKIEERGLPLELALLPIVESSFDAFAYSHGRAAGLWQFVPATGKAMGLEQNFWYDGRRDVAASTDAALNYLAQQHRRFGDWSHAIAAYNSGGGRLNSAIRQNRNAGKPTDFFSLDLPKETSGYVPKLLALADVIANQEKYGIEIPAIPNQKVVTLVDPKEQLDLAVAAEYAGISVKQLQSLNPAYNQWSTAPEEHHKLLLPTSAVAQFEQSLDENRGKGVRLVRYQVQSGDSLSVIAQRHNTTTSVIRTANGLSDNNIRIGQYLMVPNSVKDEQEYQLTANNRLRSTQSQSRGQYKIDHVVKSGESLWTIARQHKVSYRSLAQWNGMAPNDTLRVGQNLVVWKDGKEGAIIRTVVYNVRSGDTISGIASRFKVRSSDVVKWNNLHGEKYLQPGQRLTLYVDVTKVSV
ncbi:LysM peptidoglycan-binding domain-containing protein [Vibrio sp. WXL210]|uniref:LysM peptidoglycan-binding domain-containing protein n=1 Tax=Vibrio sp. WXL210 TaxID=3450709 RepID=UPI003EC7C559